VSEDGLEAVKIAGNEKIDIALLDIDMPNLDGLEAAKIINKTYPEVKIVFITGYMEYAVDSFCVHPYDYFLKPIDIDRFKKVLNDIIVMISKQFEKNEVEVDKIIIKEGQKIHFISFDDIFYFEKENRDVVVYTIKEKYILNKTLTELENNILNKSFIRTHQSFIVNKTKIKSIGLVGNKSYEIEFDGIKNKASLSRHQYKKFVKDLFL